MERIEQIIRGTRGSGNTTWILMAAIENPRCVIVSKTMQQSKSLRRMYNILLDAQPWHKKLLWKFFGKTYPRFVSINYDFSENNLPVIFDNASLILN